jgi:pyridoxal biosynthesis lyase PdxS
LVAASKNASSTPHSDVTIPVMAKARIYHFAGARGGGGGEARGR